MSTKNLTLIVVAVLILLLGGCGCSGYNNMVKLDETVKSQFGNLQSEYQRRSDLIPNLVNTVKGAANFEQKTLTDVVEARAHATEAKIDASNLTPEKMAAFQQAQGQLGTALGRLLAVSENYPTLKATQNFQDLQRNLVEIENNIQYARRYYNAVVRDLNTKIQVFPSNIIANMFNFKPREFFEVSAPVERDAPKVSFGTPAA